jgi:hypothetical protein
MLSCFERCNDDWWTPRTPHRRGWRRAHPPGRGGARVYTVSRTRLGKRRRRYTPPIAHQLHRAATTPLFTAPAHPPPPHPPAAFWGRAHLAPDHHTRSEVSFTVLPGVNARSRSDGGRRRGSASASARPHRRVDGDGRRASKFRPPWKGAGGRASPRAPGMTPCGAGVVVCSRRRRGAWVFCWERRRWLWLRAERFASGREAKN